jgi:phage-related minor tail protein
MAGTAGELAFVASLQDDASRGAKKLKSTMTDIGGPTKPITTDVRVDSSGVSKAVANVEGAEQAITNSLKEAGKVGGDKLAEGLKAGGQAGGEQAAREAKQGSDKIPAQVKAAGAKAERAGKQAGKDTGKGFADGVEGSVRGAGNAMKGVVEGIGLSGPGGAAAAGAAVGLAFVGGLRAAMDVEAETDRLNASIGATGPAAQKAGEIAGELYADAYGDSLPEVTEAVEGVIKNVADLNRTSKKDLKGISASVIDVSKVFRQDFGKTTSAIGQLMRTGLAKNATEALDLITKGLQGPANKSDDLLDTLNEYPVQFQKLGLSGKQALGLVSQGVKAGARDSDVAADSLKEFAIRAVDGSKLTADSFKAIGLNAKQMSADIAAGGPKAAAALGLTLDKLRLVEDPAKRAQIAVGLFGTQSEDMAAALGAMDLSTAESELGTVAGAAKRMGDTFNDNASVRVSAFARGVKANLVDFLGNEALPAIEGFVASVKTEFGPTFDNIKTNILPGLKTGLADAKQLWIDNKTEIKALAENTVTLAAGIQEKLTPALDAAFPVMKKIAEIDLSNTVNSIAQLNNLMAGTKDDGSKSGVADKLAQIKEITEKANLGAYFGEIAGHAIGNFGDKFLHDATTRAKVGTWLANNFNNIVSYLPLGSLINTGATAGNKIVEGLFGTTPNASATAKRYMTGLGYALGSANPLGFVQNVGRLLGVKVGDGLWGSSGTVGGKAKSLMTYVGRTIMSSTPLGVAQAAGGLLGKDFIGGLGRGLRSAIGGVISYVRGIPSQLAGGGNWGGVLVNAGQQVISGLVSGIRSAIPNVRSVLGSVTSMIPSWKGPPAKDKNLLYKAGRQIMAGLQKGFRHGEPGVMGYLTSLTKLIASKRGIGVSTVNKNLAPVTRRIVAYAKAHDTLIGKLTTARAKVAELAKVRDEYAAGIREALLTSADVTKFDTVNDAPLTAGFIAQQLRDKLKAIVDFRNNLARLRKSGLSSDIIRDIEAAGVDSGGATAAALASANKAQITELNGLQGQIRKQATDTGAVAAGAWYQNGVNAAQGVVNGITSQLKRVDAAGVALAKALNAAVRRQLGIKSPSRVMAAAGEFAGEGLGVGLVRSMPRVEKDARTMAQRIAAAATPTIGQLTALTSTRPSPIVISRVQETVVIRHEVAFRGQAPAGITAEDVADLIARNPKSAARIEQALKSPRARKASNTLKPSR